MRIMSREASKLLFLQIPCVLKPHTKHDSLPATIEKKALYPLLTSINLNIFISKTRNMKTLFFLTLICLTRIVYAQEGKTPQTKPGGKLEFYVVKEGETEGDVAKKYGITVEDLEKWNNLDDPITEGRILYLDPKVIKKPVEETSPPEEESKSKPVEKVKAKSEEKIKTKPIATNTNTDESYHTVVAGETLYHISVVYKTTVQKLMEFNEMKTPTIKEGQKLRVKK